MKLATLPLLFLLAAGLAPQVQPAKVVRLGEPFLLKFGERAAIEGTGLKIAFTDVLEDSRCPIDVVCVWQGNARLNLELRKKRRNLTSVLVNTGITPKQAEYRGFVIKLVDVDPKKRAGQQINKADYTATLVVTPLEEGPN